MAFTLSALRARLKQWSASAVINGTTYTIANQLPLGGARLAFPDWRAP